MRHVAGLAALDLHRSVLENKRALLVRMAGKADGVLGGGSANLFCSDCSMRVVTIRALHQSFVHAMMKRHFKLRFLLQVAAVAEFGLRLDQKKFFRLRIMWRMAGDTIHVVLRV